MDYLKEILALKIQRLLDEHLSGKLPYLTSTIEVLPIIGNPLQTHLRVASYTGIRYFLVSLKEYLS